MTKVLRAVLRPDPWGKTWRGKIYFGGLDGRRFVARRWMRFAEVVYEWIWP
jgi:hypothetical protein